jgi:prepilin-type processing-associated H-X9-DG protein
MKKSGKQIVFVDEGKITPDSFAISFNDSGSWHTPSWTWWDGPDSRHGDGTTLSFADGHSEYWKWCLETANRGRDVENGTATGTFPLATSPDAAFQDKYRMSLGCWGILDSTAINSTHPCKVD